MCKVVVLPTSTPFVIFDVLVAFPSSDQKVINASVSRSMLNGFIAALLNIAFPFFGLIVTR